MKKLFYTLALFIALGTTSILAQTSSPFHLGVKAGANFTNISTSLKDYSTKTATGFSGGIVSRLDLQNFYLQAEFMYTTKNTEFKSVNDVTDKANWQNVEVPLVLGYKLVNQPYFQLRAFGGGLYSNTINNDFSKESIKGFFNDFDKSNIGYRVGLGVDVYKFTVDASYDGGLSDMSNSYKSKPSSITVTVGYFFL